MKEKKRLLLAALKKSLGSLSRHFKIYVTEEMYKFHPDGYIEVLFVPPRSSDYLMPGVGEEVYSAEGDFSIQQAVWQIRRQLHEWGVL